MGLKIMFKSLLVQNFIYKEMYSVICTLYREYLKYRVNHVMCRETVNEMIYSNISQFSGNLISKDTSYEKIYCNITRT